MFHPAPLVRYFKVTLFIGFLVSLAVACLYELGAFFQLDLALSGFLGRGAPTPLGDRELQYPLFIFLAFTIAWTTVDIPRFSLKIIVAAAAFLEVIAATWILHIWGIFFSSFASAAAVALAFLGGVAYARSEGGSRKKSVSTIFGDRVSKRTFEDLVNSDLSLAFEGERIEATIIVCEIFNHHELTESLPVNDYVALHNSFLKNAADFLVERGGYLDECDGESLRAVFGAPLPDPRHAATASEAVLTLCRRLDEVNKECAQVWGKMFDYRIGVNSGEVVVAAYGSGRVGNFSVAGEPVEFTRRLCAANTVYRSRVLIGCETFNDAEGDIEVRPMELIQRYADASSREEVYELLALKHGLTEEEMQRRDLFWQGIVYYREALWDEALTIFQSIRAVDGSDGPVEFYIRRIEQLRSGLPQLEWAGR
ncbi:MAG: adenylate/guanylate cyclase domain-containing protein [Chthoniobacteraceae bacterium]